MFCLGLVSLVLTALCDQKFGHQLPEVFGAGVKPEDMALGDFNGDNRVDSAVGNMYFNILPPGGSVSIFFNEGHGTF